MQFTVPILTTLVALVACEVRPQNRDSRPFRNRPFGGNGPRRLKTFGPRAGIRQGPPGREDNPPFRPKFDFPGNNRQPNIQDGKPMFPRRQDNFDVPQRLQDSFPSAPIERPRAVAVPEQEVIANDIRRYREEERLIDDLALRSEASDQTARVSSEFSNDHPSSRQGEGGLGGPGRVTFQIHGQEGPHSYKFGYDTGKGYGRQFRYEERDNYGHVKGRYGFYDKYGKLHVVNYSADPKKGFAAEGDFGKYPGPKGH